MQAARRLTKPILTYFLAKTKLLEAFTRCYSPNESFLSGSSANYIEDMYVAWQKDPNSVHVSWDSYFRNLAAGPAAYQRPPSLAPPGRNEVPVSAFASSSTAPTSKVVLSSTPSTASSKPPDVTDEFIADNTAVHNIIRSYQTRGHIVAELDPLGILYTDKKTISDRIGQLPEEITRQHKLFDMNLSNEYTLPSTTYIGGGASKMKLGDIVSKLESVYCRHIGAEFMYITDMDQTIWIRQKLETPGALDLNPDEKKALWRRLCRAHHFEAFLAKKWASEKRFGLEGGEVMIPGIRQMIDTATILGTDTYIIGMAHRGRLNVLVNVCEKSFQHLFAQFVGLEAADQGTGDVKYHLGTAMNILNKKSNKTIKVVVVANASHLEHVNPIVQGKAKAEQFYGNDVEGLKTCAILIHGDSAFCGQGVVFETIQLSNLPAYTTKGTIHVIINNQIGFTTDPRLYRSSPYCTDVARVVNAPIFHVNGDDPEASMIVSKIASEWRYTFKTDVVVDFVCYRRAGHNEIDEPMFTQPLMYKKITKLTPVFLQYTDKLLHEGIMTEDEQKSMVDEYIQQMEAGLEAARKMTHIKLSDWIDSPWPGFFKNKDPLKCKPTGVSEDILKHIGTVFSTPPKDFALHRGLERVLAGRKKMVEERQADWSFGEAFAFGSLLMEGTHVRLSGQDVERGTFSHRHHVLHDQNIDMKQLVPLNSLKPGQAHYHVSNSCLSECSVIGFELGFSMHDPNSLVMWEAQFGDFANTAQAIIDQFLASGEAKWVRQVGLVMLLPHGYEGQGPEHSSARIERFLQLCSEPPHDLPTIDQDLPMRQLKNCNLILCNCTTPANMFHVLRRQLALPFRKPLIVFTPKSLLRHPEAKSSFDEMLEGTEFKRVIPDEKNTGNAKKLVFCSGKVYYDGVMERDKHNLTSAIAIVRVEQMSPFPYVLIQEQIEKHPNANICWLQEEHQNQGPWIYMLARFNALLKGSKQVTYIGREASASTSCGSKATHTKELELFLADLIKL